MRHGLLAAALLAVAVGGCGTSTARVKGQVLENGQPKSFTGQAAVTFAPVGPDGKPDNTKSYTAVVNGDGSFEVVVSGGQLPPGQYQVSVQVVGPAGAKLKAFSAANSQIRRALKPGDNEITIDLANPNG